MAKVLLVDDERSMRLLIERILESAGYEAVSACDGAQALELYDGEHPDIVVLDIMMPGLDGFATCRALRAKGADIPVIFLTAKGDISDMGLGFGAGGDDYLVKPFDSRELLMRIEAHLKRYRRIAPKKPEDALVEIGDFEFDIANQRATLRGERIDFTPKEFRILCLLASHPGEVFTRDQLIEAVWGEEFVGETSSLPVFIRKIREKIEDDPSHPKYLQTAWRSGYRFGD